MAFGFPAHYEEVHGYSIHPDYLAPGGPGHSHPGLEGRRVLPLCHRGQVPLQSPLVLGEKMMITIYQDGTIHVGSQCVFVLQWYDYGKNKEHVTQFFYQVTAVSGYQPLS